MDASLDDWDDRLPDNSLPNSDGIVENSEYFPIDEESPSSASSHGHHSSPIRANLVAHCGVFNHISNHETLYTTISARPSIYWTFAQACNKFSSHYLFVHHTHNPAEDDNRVLTSPVRRASTSSAMHNPEVCDNRTITSQAIQDPLLSPRSPPGPGQAFSPRPVGFTRSQSLNFTPNQQRNHQESRSIQNSGWPYPSRPTLGLGLRRVSSSSKRSTTSVSSRPSSSTSNPIDLSQYYGLILGELPTVPDCMAAQKFSLAKIPIRSTSGCTKITSIHRHFMSKAILSEGEDVERHYCRALKNGSPCLFSLESTGGTQGRNNHLREAHPEELDQLI
ncbi:hypothetical protein BGZ76_004979, partial [Entomortierella beljakovae]